MPAIAPPTLADGELTVRPLRAADVPALAAACQDPQISRWTSVPAPYTREDAVRFVTVAAAEAAAGDGLALAVTLRPHAAAEPDGSERLAGTVGLMGVDRARGRGEIGYWTAAEARGRGLAPRAVALLRDWARRELGLTLIELHAHRDNVPSQRVAERAGFRFTGRIASLPRMPPGKRDGYKVYVWQAPSAEPDG